MTAQDWMGRRTGTQIDSQIPTVFCQLDARLSVNLVSTPLRVVLLRRKKGDMTETFGTYCSSSSNGFHLHARAGILPFLYSRNCISMAASLSKIEVCRTIGISNHIMWHALLVLRSKRASRVTFRSLG